MPNRKNTAQKRTDACVPGDSRGFTLAETLVAIIILLLVSGIVAAGIPAAARAYDKVVMASNAEALMSTTVTSLRNELGNAKDISISKDSSGDLTIITYYNGAAGTYSRIYTDVTSSSDSSSNIMYQRSVADGVVITSSANDSTPARLVSEEASDSSKNLHVTYDSVEDHLADGYITFNGLKVTRKDGTTVLTKLDSYSVRVFTY